MILMYSTIYTYFTFPFIFYRWLFLRAYSYHRVDGEGQGPQSNDQRSTGH